MFGEIAPRLPRFIRNVISSVQNQVLMSNGPNTPPSFQYGPPIVNVSSNVTLTPGATHLINTSALRTVTLPTPVSGLLVILKDSTFQAQTNAITVARHASENIDGVAASYTMASNGAFCRIVSNGTDWFIIG